MNVELHALTYKTWAKIKRERATVWKFEEFTLTSHFSYKNSVKSTFYYYFTLLVVFTKYFSNESKFLFFPQCERKRGKMVFESKASDPYNKQA